MPGALSPGRAPASTNRAWYACDDFAKQLGKAGGSTLAYELRPAQRAEFVGGLAESAGRSTTPLIKDAAEVLARTVDGSRSAWKLGMDTFAARCLDRGWHAT
ncbi:MAG: hypothetical protein ACT4NY_34240 [Pseudonocardiales bacterium]